MAGTPQSSASIPSFPKPWSDHDTVIVFLYTRSLCSYIAHCKMLMACDVLPIYSHTRWSCLVMNDKFNIVYRILIWINLYSYRYFPPRNDILLTKSGRGEKLKGFTLETDVYRHRGGCWGASQQSLPPHNTTTHT